ncbi:MAG: hypothetical protein JXR48_08900 [Candidatus Delongbacteria bacterium]|nr:hypothetical protein [Candidatus Delongbacteria bacterium]MBN2835070.1 hypothetical protein [Candidatus Delongbacteria bacterium]
MSSVDKSENISIYISKHKLLLKKLSQMTKELLKLDLDEDPELLAQIIQNREKVIVELSKLYNNIEDMKRCITNNLFLELYKDNDFLIEEILNDDKIVIDKINQNQDDISTESKGVSKSIKALNSYKISKINRSFFIDRKT